MSGLLDWLLNLLYPPKCVFCRRLLKENESDCCSSCRKSLPEHLGNRNGRFFQKCYCVFDYRDRVRDSILRYKFSGMQHYAAAYGRLLAMKLLREEAEFDVLTWVPVSKKRLKKRGFDQTELLARAVARELDVPLVSTLHKVKHNPAQSTMKDASARAANVRNAYVAVHPQHFHDKNILLIDDVITTGATLSECSSVLLTAGAARVDVATFASANHSESKDCR